MLLVVGEDEEGELHRHSRVKALEAVMTDFVELLLLVKWFFLSFSILACK